MTDIEVDVKALAALARLEVSEAELQTLKKQIPDILAFVRAIEEVSADVPKTDPEHRNIMRADENPHESGIYTERLVKAMPKSRNNQLVVKQVISRKK